MKRLLLDTSNVRLIVGRGFMPKLDPDKKQKTERGTGRPLYTAQLIADTEEETEDASMFLVTVAGENPPKLTRGAPVTVTDLEAIPWVNKSGSVQVAYRATSITPASASKSPAA